MRFNELGRNEYVVFEIDGKEYKANHLEVVWGRKEQAWWILDDNNEKVFSNDVRTKAPRKNSNNAPMVEIHPDTSTEKAYGIIIGTNRSVVKSNFKVYYKWIAKSVCKKENGRIYAPIWAVK